MTDVGVLLFGMEFISGIFFFILLVGVLVFIHEAGHFMMAKLFNVKVHVFSLGMGPRIFGFVRGDTDYRISAVPVGGYVRMLGEDPTEELIEADRGRALTDKPAWQRTLILVAGPAMNLIFPVFLYFFLSLSDSRIYPAEIGQVFPGSPAAAAGLQAGDEILSVDSAPIYSFGDMVDTIKPNPGKPLAFRIKRGDRILDLQIKPSTSVEPRYPYPQLRHIMETKGRVGVSAAYEGNIVEVIPEGLAALSGLSTFDRIIEVNGRPTARLIDLEKALKNTRGTEVSLVYQKLSEPMVSKLLTPVTTREQAAALPKSAYEKTRHTAKLSVPAAMEQLSDVGLAGAGGIVLRVMKDSAAQKAGLRPGDRLIGIDGRRASIYEIESTLVKFDEKTQNTLPHRLTYLRDGKEAVVKLRASFIPGGTAKELGLVDDTIDTGLRTVLPAEEWLGVLPDSRPSPFPIAYAWKTAWRETLHWGGVILDILKSIFTGKISPKGFSGPIGIGTAAAQMGQEGPGAYFGFMGFVSLNLGILNLLLPIPVLDGGRLVLVGAEVVMRRRLSNRLQERIMVVGAVMTILLMVWAVIMDIARALMG